MIGNYIQQRLKPVQFLLLAIFLYLLVYPVQAQWTDVVSDALFLFVSFIVFRFIDDAGSVTIDRINHPDRTYLSAKNYTSFLVVTILLSTCYAAAVFIYDRSMIVVIPPLMAGSVLLYLFSHKSGVMMKVIPLLKYPLLLLCISASNVDSSEILVVWSSFLIMLIYDLIDDRKEQGDQRIILLILIIACGMLVFQPWHDWIWILFIIPPIVIVLMFSKSKLLKYLPILYFPLSILIKTLVQ
jgi:hypothetical protein